MCQSSGLLLWMMGGLMNQPAVVLEVWQHAPRQAQSGCVLPDGCCDLIWHRLPNGRSNWFVTRLYDRATPLEVVAGEHFCGYRLQPGSRVNEINLLNALQDRSDPDAVDVLGLLDACVSLDPELTEALDCLAGAGSIASATRQLGISERSLERWVRLRTGRTPSYWRQLARVRRTARSLSHSMMTLVDIAFEHGYADQAQMSRDFQRWFGVSPRAFRHDPVLQALIAAPGFD